MSRHFGLPQRDNEKMAAIREVAVISWLAFFATCIGIVLVMAYVVCDALVNLG